MVAYLRMDNDVVLISSESDSNNSNSSPARLLCTGNEGFRLGVDSLVNKRWDSVLDERSPNKYDLNSEDRLTPNIPDCNRVVHDISCSESSFEGVCDLNPQLCSDEGCPSSNPNSRHRPNFHDLSDEESDTVDGDTQSPDDVTMVCSGSGVEDTGRIRPQQNSDKVKGTNPSSFYEHHSGEDDDTVDEAITRLHEDETLQYDAIVDFSPEKDLEHTSPHTSETGCDNQEDVFQDQIENNNLQTRLSSLFSNATYSQYNIESTGTAQGSRKTKNTSNVKVSKEEKQLAAKLKREAREAERARKLAEKAELKAAKLALSKARQLLKPEESIKYLSIVLDNNIFELDLGGNLYSELESIGVSYSVKSQLVPLSVSWIRKNPNTCNALSEQHEQHSLLILPYDQVAKLIKNKELCIYVKSIQEIAPHNIFTLILFAVENIFRPHKKKKGIEEYKISREELTEALVEVQLFTNSNHRFVENCVDLATTIGQFSKAVAEIPYKLEKQKQEQDKLEWFGESDNQDCVRVDKNGNGLMRLWRQQLCEFNLAGLQIAEAITAIYPSPQALFQAYDRCLSQKEREKLLQDIQIRRGVGPLSSARRIGPELSKKLHTFFTTLNGDTELSNE